MYLSDAHMKHKYVRKGLVLIGALKDKGNSMAQNIRSFRTKFHIPRLRSI